MKKQIVAMILAVVTVLMCCAFTSEVNANENGYTITVNFIANDSDNYELSNNNAFDDDYFDYKNNDILEPGIYDNYI